MGRIRKDEKRRATDACRVPPHFSPRSWFATAVNKLKKQNGLPNTSSIDLGLFISFWIIVLLFLPLWNLPSSFGASLQVTQGQEVDWNNGFDITTIPYAGGNEALLLNETPYDDSPIWDTGSYFLEAQTSLEEDGYTISISGPINGLGFFSCMTSTSVSIPDINKLLFSVILDGIEGSCNVTLSIGFTALGVELWTDLFERSLTSSLARGETINLTISAPIDLLKTISPVWLPKAAMTIFFTGTPSAKVKIKETTIKAISDKPLYPMTIDAIATTGESLYSSYLTRYLRYPPVLYLNRSDGIGSPAILLRRSNYTIFLPQGQYPSLAGWYNYDRYNPIIDGLNVTLDVLPDEMIHLQLKMRAYRLDITSNPPIPFRSLTIRDSDVDNILDTSFGYSPWPEHLYLPPDEGDISITVRFDQWHLRTQTSFSEGYTHTFSFTSPLTINIFGLMLSLGQLLDIGLIFLIFILIMKRWFVLTAQMNRRALIFDERFVPLVMLISSFFFPWISYSDYSVYQSSFFVALPVRALTFQGNIVFTAISFGEWIIIGLLALVLLWAPFIVLLFQLPTPQSKSSDRRTVKLLLLPFLYGLFFLVGVLLSGSTLGLGVILAMLGLPIWLLQQLLRRNIGFPNIRLSSKKEEGSP